MHLDPRGQQRVGHGDQNGNRVITQCVITLCPKGGSLGPGSAAALAGVWQEGRSRKGLKAMGGEPQGNSHRNGKQTVSRRRSQIQVRLTCPPPTQKRGQNFPHSVSSLFL